MPGRRPARDSTTVGSPQGIHLPGIYPEPAVVETEGPPSESERRVLEDLETALPPEDRAEEGEAGEGAAESVPPVELPRQRAQFPWWYATYFLGFATVGFLLTGWSQAESGQIGIAAATLGLAMACAAGAWRTIAQRRRARQSM